jgi:methylated-DNA-[protein]-cysteine S-methyltransferase
MSNQTSFSGTFKSPFGDLIIVVDEAGTLTYVALPNGHARWANEVIERGLRVVDDPQRCGPVFQQLEEYFQHKRQAFDLPLRAEGTDFQRSVWTALQAIPYGSTITYKTLAQQIGQPEAVRAVGRANGSNPIPIVIPCHRVIGADGSLTGFGGGLLLKEQLLDLEGALEHVKPAARQLALM